MKNEIWFRQRRFGWGWTPANAKGWSVIGAYLIVLVSYPVLTKLGFVGFSEKAYLVVLGFATILLIAISFLKGEKPGWRWG